MVPAAAAQYFSQTYAEARDKFVDAAKAAGLAVQSHLHPQRGREGEDLAMDVARFGDADADAVLLITSACHGVEGFCGSGVQNALLADVPFHAEAHRRGVALVYVHALNPHGFSWWRRVTDGGVDLNRNWPDFAQPLPRNAHYDAIADDLVPDGWPPGAAVEASLAEFTDKYGERGFQAAVSGGQYHHPGGLFYGGTEPTWSHRTLRAVLREHGGRCARLGWIDLHTGLGPSGHGEKILATRDDAVALARARAWWGQEVTSMYDGSSASALLTGLMWNAADEECAQAVYTGIALEYGTVPMAEVITALRGDHWLYAHADRAVDGQAPAIRQRMRDAFYTDTDAWKARVVEQGLAAARQGVVGLAA